MWLLIIDPDMNAGSLTLKARSSITTFIVLYGKKKKKKAVSVCQSLYFIPLLGMLDIHGKGMTRQ